MNCIFCKESTNYRYCETCQKGSLPECDKSGHSVYPVCSDCLHTYFECDDLYWKHKADKLTCPRCIEICERSEKEQEENNREEDSFEDHYEDYENRIK